eukprot:GHVU01224632.1.p1 GENE.GHVU01224632.1~~GHVU01224632.1.p1  ORF type:complete len:421 (-),score=82.16 GHVU01224632.1:537-1799(-)
MCSSGDAAVCRLWDPDGEHMQFRNIFESSTSDHVVVSAYSLNGAPYDRCPRTIAANCQQFVKDGGYADEILFGPEPEFFVFDDVSFSTDINKTHHKVDGDEAYWNSGSLRNSDRGPNLAFRPGKKKHYMPAPPLDHQDDLRMSMMRNMTTLGIPMEKHHHEVAGLQHELGFRCGSLQKTADYVLLYKWIVKMTAKQHKMSATFLPKPVFADNGSGMHCHQSLWKDGVNLFYDRESAYHQLSDMCRWYIGGLLHHAPALVAFTNPTTNSYKRLVPGFEAPVALVYAAGNRSAAVRVPIAGVTEAKHKRIEFRVPDASACPYLSFAAQTMAGIDGVIRQIEPPAPMDVDLYTLTAEEKKRIRMLPETLADAVDALERDTEFLLRGGVFPRDLIDDYVKAKRAEALEVELIPHPREFELYYHK